MLNNMIYGDNPREGFTRNGTFRSFLPANLESLILTVSRENLAIINQLELDDRIERGTWIKIPR
ncbi:hypothetical protein BH23BAC3_BH23BAC3_26960 [soil metagenome]